MYVRFLFVLLLLSSQVLAEELSVKYGLYIYQLDISAEKLHLTGKGLDLSVTNKKCNEKIFSSFKENVLNAIDKLEIRKSKAQEKVEISYGKKETKYSPKSPQGRYFLGLPDEFKKLKIHEKLKCK